MASLIRPLRFQLVRNVDVGDLLESFLVCGVAALLGIRFYLELTGYPQVGGRGLHIAHMLWGGLLMLIAIVLLLGYLGKHVQRLAAVLGGIGFGIFIDELGKFITSDNNYLFRPAIALIYIAFVTLFLVFRAIQRRRAFSADEYLINAIDLIKEAALNDLDRAEKERALRFLERSDAKNPLVGVLRETLHRLNAIPTPRTALPARLFDTARRAYRRLVGAPWFAIVLVAVFIAHALFDLVILARMIASDPRFDLSRPHLSFVDWGDLLGSTAAALLVLVGVARLVRSRLSAYLWFRRAILVSIFVSQFFSFYAQQLLALVGLVVEILVLVALDYMIAAEQTEAGAATAEPIPAWTRPHAANN